ncbi:aromatic amino acid lyase [Actinocrinis puniceicyclus]|uniref:Aromatic amino acid lyase n=1 Tax=Actinocrinis puniceicyclus TaxID=977794 RepID=A0A8J7WI69_9ACTN|nr:aromatic amino acid ammonia-lyase [Actinocrinis puniceicyclus]MBS2962636.1 aromatic amino acid lyase [Actinocrinis puniceicyclus]
MEHIELTGQSLTPEQVVLLARGEARAQIAPRALTRAAAAAAAAERIAARRPVYGRTTGVGANRTQRVADGDLEHGVRLLRSHAGGIGRPIEAEATRAMLAVRANQLLAGGAGLRAQIIEAIVQALDAGALPEIREYGGLGTADLTALAELGLTLIGEAPWRADTDPTAARSTDRQPAAPAAVTITSGDALALMSSSALTIGRSCLAWHEASRWISSAHAVAALSVFALDGSTEPFDEAVHQRRPHPGLMRSARIVRALLAGQSVKAARIQDPFALRCIPQVHGAALEALESTERVLRVEVNVASENPLFVTGPEGGAEAGGEADEAVFHHGGFHQALLTQSLDALNLALLSTGQLSLARLDLMFHPEFTGLRPFLADGEPASSGVMILENAAHDALSELRNAAMPAGLGHATLSRGVEDHSPFTSQSARQTARAAEALRLILATELVGALRTLRLRGLKPSPGTPLAQLYAIVELLDARTADRSTTPDVLQAVALLPSLAAAVPSDPPGQMA